MNIQPHHATDEDKERGTVGPRAIFVHLTGASCQLELRLLHEDIRCGMPQGVRHTISVKGLGRDQEQELSVVDVTAYSIPAPMIFVVGRQWFGRRMRNL